MRWNGQVERNVNIYIYAYVRQWHCERAREIDKTRKSRRNRLSDEPAESALESRDGAEAFFRISNLGRVDGAAWIASPYFREIIMLKEFVRVFFPMQMFRGSNAHREGAPFSLVSNLGRADGGYRVLNWKFVIWRNYNVERICCCNVFWKVPVSYFVYLNLNIYIFAARYLHFFASSLPLLFNDFSFVERRRNIMRSY